MLASSKQYDDVEKNLRDIRKSIESWSKTPAMHDDALYNNAVALAKGWNAAIDAASNGKGPMGPLLANRQLYDSLDGTAKSLRSFVGDFRKDPRKYLRIKVF